MSNLCKKCMHRTSTWCIQHDMEVIDMEGVKKCDFYEEELLMNETSQKNMDLRLFVLDEKISNTKDELEDSQMQYKILRDIKRELNDKESQLFLALANHKIPMLKGMITDFNKQKSKLINGVV